MSSEEKKCQVMGCRERSVGKFHTEHYAREEVMELFDKHWESVSEIDKMVFDTKEHKEWEYSRWINNFQRSYYQSGFCGPSYPWFCKELPEIGTTYLNTKTYPWMKYQIVDCLVCKNHKCDESCCDKVADPRTYNYRDMRKCLDHVKGYVCGVEGCTRLKREIRFWSTKCPEHNDRCKTCGEHYGYKNQFNREDNDCKLCRKK